jgi:predicted dehydrogenase
MQNDRRHEAAASRDIRFGVVGAGYIAQVTAAAMAEAAGATLAAVASRRRERAEWIAASYEGVTVFDDWRALVASDDVDAVYVATPTAAREPIAVAAAEAGKHVLAEKPFANLASLRRIAGACRAAGTAFMDGTHFVHHPRTLQLQRELHARIGEVRAITSCFFFPSDDRANIRLDPRQEPTGAIGDMAWYSMRAVVAFVAAEAVPVSATGCAEKDAVTGAIVRGAGMLRLSGGCTSTWDVGYNTGAFVQDLTLLGERGLIALDDFVLDWAGGFPIPSPEHVAGFTQRAGLATPSAFERVATPADRRQAVLMVEAFTELARAPGGRAAEASIVASERTQALLDAVVDGLTIL